MKLTVITLATILMAFLVGCGNGEPTEVSVTLEDTSDHGLINYNDTMPDTVPALQPDFYLTGTFIKTHFGGTGDFLQVRDSAGQNRNIFAGFLANGSELVQNEYLYRERTVRIGYVQREVIRFSMGDTIIVDSLVTLSWPGLLVKVGQEADEIPLSSALSRAREGDTLQLSSGIHKLSATAEWWGLRGVTIRGASGDEPSVIEGQQLPVLKLENCERIRFRNLHFEVRDLDTTQLASPMLQLIKCKAIRFSNVSGVGSELGIMFTDPTDVVLRNSWLDVEQPIIRNEVPYSKDSLSNDSDTLSLRGLRAW